MSPATTAGSVIVAVCCLFGRARADDKPPEHFSLSISGGVSLGAYEAGATRGLLRYLRKLDTQGTNLVALTGASAGAINALIAADAWCAINVEAGAFDVWLDVGIDELLPAQFDDKDGIFAASALKPGGDRLLKRIESASHRDCSIPISFTVTRAMPETLRFEQVSAGNQLFVVHLMASSKHGGPLRFRNRTELSVVSPTEQRRRLYLRETGPGGEVSAGDVLEAVLASAAFPAAFRARTLCYCALGESSRKEDPAPKQCSGTCPRPYSPRRAPFIDGGVFDNIGLAAAIAQAEHGRDKSRGLPVRYVFFDPGLRRPADEFERAEQEQDWPARAFYVRRSEEQHGRLEPDPDYEQPQRVHSEPLGKVIDSARQANLFEVLATAFGPKHQRQLVRADRYWPLAAEQLHAFAAFLDRGLREHDMLIGEYECAHNIAARIRGGPVSKDGVADVLRIVGSPQNQGLLARLNEQEIRAGGHMLRPSMPAVVRRLDLNRPESVQLPWRVHWALTAGHTSTVQLPFDVFLSILEDTGFRFQSTRAASLLAPPWRESFVLGISDRMRRLKQDDLLSKAGTLGKLAMESVSGRSADGDSWAWRLLPDAAIVGITPTGFGLAQELFGRNYGVQTHAGWRVRPTLSLGLAYACRCANDSLVEHGPWRWTPRIGGSVAVGVTPFAVGGEAWIVATSPFGEGRNVQTHVGGFVGLAAETLRVSVGRAYRRWIPHPDRDLNGWYVTIAFRNLVEMMKAVF